ncbi:MAG: hypothetical protein ACPGF7_08310 [Pontibacterium sp.]
MSRANPYAFDPNLMQGFSNLTRALIGSASDDAALARARASDATARYRDSQTAYQDGLTGYLNDATSAINTALNDSALLNSMFSSTGLKSGNAATNPTGRPGPFIGNDPNTSMSPGVSEDAMRGLVRSMFFGGVPGNPQQSAAGAQTLADMVNQQAAYDLLSNSGQSPDRQAAIRLGMNPGQYFDQGSAEALARIANPITLNPGQTGFMQTDDGAVNIGTNTNMAPQTLNPGQSTTGYDGQITDTAEPGPLVLKNNEAAFDSNNQLIAENRAPAGPIILSDGQTAFDSTGKEVAANPKDPGVIELNEGQVAFVPDADSETGYKMLKGAGKSQTLILSPGQTGVVVRADGTKTTITAAEGPRVLEAGANETVQLVKPKADGTGYDVVHEVKGPAVKKTSGSGSSGSGDGGVGTGSVLNMTRYQTQWTKTYEELGSPDLPKHAIGGMKTLSSQLITAAAKANPNMDVNQLYDAIAVPIIAAGTYEVTKGSNFFVPKYFVDYYVNLSPDEFARENSVPANAPAGTMSAFRTTFMQRMNYNDNQVNRLLQEIQQMRSQ